MYRLTDATNQILNIFEGFRMAPTSIDQYETVGKSILADKIDSFVRNHKTIDFVMLGFPFKSTNDRDKVLGKIPDLAEKLTLDNIARFNNKIKEVYAPGVTLSMASDGYVFNDILGASDDTVQRYAEMSMDMTGDAPMRWYSLQDFYSGNSLVSKRERVMSQFGITPEKMQELILLSPDVNYLYRGMIRFMQEEVANRGFVSGNQLQKAAKLLTREMMLRNEAWSNLTREEFKSHIRLSMHPSVNSGAKYSFQLIDSPKAHHSAWHCTIAIDNGEIITMHKADAIAQGFELVYQNGQPFYFQK